jgi:hypothetical protein
MGVSDGLALALRIDQFGQSLFAGHQLHDRRVITPFASTASFINYQTVTVSFDYLVGPGEKRSWNRQTEGGGRLEIDD